MANEFYTRSAEFNPDEVADGDAIESEFDAVARGFDMIGTASKKNATTSNMDITAGSLMAVGDFGLGGTVPISISSEQANNQATPNGLYITAGSGVGIPGGLSGTGFLVHQRATSSATQLFIYISGSNRSFRRVFDGANWGAWLEILTSNNVTSNDTDTTAGKLLKVGDFGLGAAGTVKTRVSDLNAITAAGFYVTLSNASPIPLSNVSGYLWHQDWDGTTDYKRQVWFAASAERVFIRFCIARVWGEWTEVYHKGNIVGTVSQLGGIPTGAIAESGSNANGRYARFANGTQICTMLLSVTSAIDMSSLGGFRNLSTQLTFPAAFSLAPTIGATPQLDSAISCVCLNNTTTSVNVALTSVSPHASASRTAHVTAIGRWF